MKAESTTSLKPVLKQYYRTTLELALTCIKLNDDKAAQESRDHLCDALGKQDPLVKFLILGADLDNRTLIIRRDLSGPVLLLDTDRIDLGLFKTRPAVDSLAGFFKICKVITDHKAVLQPRNRHSPTFYSALAKVMQVIARHNKGNILPIFSGAI